jgi:hypothetical protein
MDFTLRDRTLIYADGGQSVGPGSKNLNAVSEKPARGA